MEWNDESAIDWTSVTGICGFWDGSCTEKVCGAGITVSFFKQGLGWVIRYKKCGPVKSSNSLDAELGGCVMLIESRKIWMHKCEKSSVLLRGCPASRAGLARACHGEGTFVGTEG